MAAIRVAAVPTAVLIGTPQAITISGTRKEPPETPTIPEPNPVMIAAGNATHRLIWKVLTLDLILIIPKRFAFSESILSEAGINMIAPAAASMAAKIIFR